MERLIMVIIPASIISIIMLEVFDTNIEVGKIQFIGIIILLGVLCTSMVSLISKFI